MREVREVLPARSAPQILRAQDAVAGCQRATFNGGCPGTSETWDASAPAPKMDDVVCAHNFFRRKGTKPILQATVTLYIYVVEI